LYLEAISHQILSDSDLRPVVQALAAIRTAEAAESAATSLSRMGRTPRTFDLDRYRMVVRACFAHLVLGPLDADWTRYDGRVSLQHVYVPQSVKQALPPTDIVRDYVKRAPQVRAEDTLEEFLNRLRVGSTPLGGVEPEPDADAEEERARERSVEYSQVASIPLMDVIEESTHTRVVLLGDPGLGKSTLLKSLALRWTDEPSRPLPLFIELRRAVDYDDLLKFMETGPLQTCCLPSLE